MHVINKFSYFIKECDKKRPSRNPKGFPSSGYGLNLTVKFVKHEDWWTAVVNWNKPKPERKCKNLRLVFTCSISKSYAFYE